MLETLSDKRELIGATEFPSLQEVAGALVYIRRAIFAACDVRLQVYDNGNWAVRYGSSDYDQDHRGYWGASSICPEDDDKALNLVALDLLDQAADAAAMSAD